MTVFKAFFQIIREYKGTVILYTALLIGFSIFNMSTNETSMTFTPSKPDIYIVNQDQGEKISSHLVSYLKKNCHLVSLKNDEEKINDAVFYRDVNYVVYIPEHYSQDLLSGKHPEIPIKSTGDYQASLAQMLLERYLKIQRTFVENGCQEEALLKHLDHILKTDVTVKVNSKINTSSTSKATFYFNFASYSIMACVMYIVCLILSSFNQEDIKKRTMISSLNYKKYNRQLLLSSFVYSLFLWLIYVIAAFVIVGNTLLSMRGFIYITNALIFTFCSLTLALMISSLITDKNAVSGIVNVVALGSAFLAGVFVPSTWLPDIVLKIAHILPSYWYVQSNDLLKNIEYFHFDTLQPIFINMAVLIGFSLLFIIINNLILKRKQVID